MAKTARGENPFPAPLRLHSYPFNPEEWIARGWKNHEEYEYFHEELDFWSLTYPSPNRVITTKKWKDAEPGEKLGNKWFVPLLADYRQERSKSVLEKLYQAGRIGNLVLLGSELQSPGDYHYVLFFYRDNGKWNWNRSWVDDVWSDFSAVSCAVRPKIVAENINA